MIKLRDKVRNWSFIMPNDDGGGHFFLFEFEREMSE